MTEQPVEAREPADPVDPERVLIVARLDDRSEPAAGRFLLVRYAEDGPLRLLEAPAPGAFERLEDVVGDALRMRLGLEPAGEPLLGATRRPRRAARWREGGVGTGWERAAAVVVAGEPEPRLPLAGFEALPLAEAESALATSLERELLREGAELLSG
jgi:hypothetical protein